jgi:hypothetical protein
MENTCETRRWVFYPSKTIISAVEFVACLKKSMELDY